MSIRVTGTNGPRATTSTKKAGKSGSKSGEFANTLNQVSGAEETVSSAAIESSPAISAVDALLAVQQADDATSGQSNRQRAISWGEGILDRLDQIRMALLLGHVPPEKLHQIANEVASRKGKTGDPVLESVLNEIEIRAAVEIAKHSRR